VNEHVSPRRILQIVLFGNDAIFTTPTVGERSEVGVFAQYATRPDAGLAVCVTWRMFGRPP